MARRCRHLGASATTATADTSAGATSAAAAATAVTAAAAVAGAASAAPLLPLLTPSSSRFVSSCTAGGIGFEIDVDAGRRPTVKETRSVNRLST